MNRSLAISVASLLSVAPATARAQGGLGIKGGVSYGNVSNSGVLPGNLTSSETYKTRSFLILAGLGF